MEEIKNVIRSKSVKVPVPRWSHREILTMLQIPNHSNATKIVSQSKKENVQIHAEKLI